jgi:glucokinase
MEVLGIDIGGTKLAAGVVNVEWQILAPERVVIGGGVTRASDLLFEPLRREVKSRIRLVPMDFVPLLPAALGADVGILGAAAVALEP